MEFLAAAILTGAGAIGATASLLGLRYATAGPNKDSLPAIQMVLPSKIDVFLYSAILGSGTALGVLSVYYCYIIIGYCVTRIRGRDRGEIERIGL